MFEKRDENADSKTVILISALEKKKPSGYIIMDVKKIYTCRSFMVLYIPK